jgi:hypothetical protein
LPEACCSCTEVKHGIALSKAEPVAEEALRVRERERERQRERDRDRETEREKRESARERERERGRGSESERESALFYFQETGSYLVV